MKTLYEDIGVIMGFLLLVFIVNSLVGEKASEAFCLLTLLTMVILNSGKITSFLSNAFN